MSSAITTSLAVDPPLVQDANYQFTPADRRYIDDQVRGVEQHLVDALIKGRHGSWFDLSGGSVAIVPGDVLCMASSLGTVTKAVSAALTNAKAALGVAIYGASPGGKVFVAFGGIVPPSITGLAASNAGSVRVNGTTGRLERVSALANTDYGIGVVDNAGYMQVAVIIIMASNPSGTPTGTGIPHVVGGIQNSAASLIVDADVSATAALAVSKLAPSGTNGWVLTTTAGVPVWAAAASGGATPAGSTGELQFNNGGGTLGATTGMTAGAGFINLHTGTLPAIGYLRIPTGASTILASKDFSGTIDLSFISVGVNDQLFIGTDTGLTSSKQCEVLSLFSNGSVQLGISGNTVQQISSTLVQTAKPMVGMSGANSPWGAVDGMAIIPVSASTITLSAAQYSRAAQKFTGTPGAAVTVTYPLPATDDQSYVRVVWAQQTVSGLVITNGGGVTVSIVANDTPHVLLFTQTGVVKIT